MPQYFNRELSWLSFNRRVLDQARSSKYLPLERVRFLAYVSINLDEFFEVRVGGLLHDLKTGEFGASPDGMSSSEQLTKVREQVTSLVENQQALWSDELIPLLRASEVSFRQIKDLSEDQKNALQAYYEAHVHPLLTPLAIDPAHPFPRFTNKATHVLVSLQRSTDEGTQPLLAVVPIPGVLPRIIGLNDSTGTPFYVFISDLLHLFADKLFPGYSVLGSWAFRITRNTDWFQDEEHTDDLLQDVEEELIHQRKGDPVRLEVQEGIPPAILTQMKNFLHLGDAAIYFAHGPINLGRLMQLVDLVERPDLKFPQFAARIPPALSRPEGLFAAIAREDYILHHPYDSFAPVVDFIAQAARDPDVRAIKQTLYRTSGDSPVVEALKQAAWAGKEVTVLVELKARFEEANNIGWARQLEEAGAAVVYGLVGYKTHCKTCLIVREEGSELKRYAHLSTGNYHPRTARSYTDIGLFTANPLITAEVAELFNALTGFVEQPRFEQMLVAPFNLHARLLELIEHEKSAAQVGGRGYIFAKVNSLMDPSVIEALCAASQAGVKIDLLVRGICCLIPGVAGYSQNIRVFSLLGRFLEHSRILYTLNEGGEPNVYVGSADWMPRNFFHRVETVFPILSPALKKMIINDWIVAFLSDDIDRVELGSDGQYRALEPQKHLSAQQYFLEKAIAPLSAGIT